MNRQMSSPLIIFIAHLISEQMGRILQRTSISTNIKERLDFSCALFDHTGGLVSNAPHIPGTVKPGLPGPKKIIRPNLAKNSFNKAQIFFENLLKHRGQI